MNIEKKIKWVGFIIILWGLIQIAICSYSGWLKHLNVIGMYQLYFGIGFIASGIGIILRKRWSRSILIATAGSNMIVLIIQFIFLGIYGITVFYILAFLLTLVFILFINIASVIEYLGAFQKGYYKILLGAFLVLIIAEIIWGINIWYMGGGNKFQGIKPFAYNFINGASKVNYIRTSFPFRYSIELPEGFFIYKVVKGKEEGIHVWLCDSKKTFIILNPAYGFRYLYEIASSPYFFEDVDSYEFAKRFLSERYGLYSLWFKTMCADKYKVDQFQIGGIRGFKIFEMEENFISNIYFYDNNQIIGSIDIINHGGINEEQVNRIIASVQLNRSSFSEQKYFQEAKIFYEMREYEHSKFLFASALIINPRNAESYYYMSSSLYETGNIICAQDILEEALRQKKDYQEAKDLLAEIKKIESSKKNNQKKDK